MAVEVGYKYKGEDFLFLVEIDADGKKVIRPFDQTGGSESISADELEVNTKDRTGADYGNVSQTISLEGEIAEGDVFVPEMKKAIRAKKQVKIFVVNVKTLEAEYGMYTITTFDREFGNNGEFATYSLEGSLFGEICETKLNRIPDGVPTPEGMVCEPETTIPEEGSNGSEG